ncbi:hypothetical protein AMS68_003848 [Peltaster fructicola]|uniref:Vacuolar ATPase assembly protein VMA22 n=1 Tax=Peltaster fructicola TaxID=286661 RepID=A0A6H0XUI8_9PEZI|nr:hypothetical protein AMS68_003848 [Peltaster fructicola]
MSTTEALETRLDTLWSEYLDLLDAYTRGQKQIQLHFAAGFFSLAQANARSSIGRRYGSDWYDDRTKATARVSIAVDETAVAKQQEHKSHTGTTFGLIEEPQYVPSGKKEPERPSTKTEPVQEPTPPATPVPESTDASEAEDDPVPTQKQQKNPLFWYGMLPPPSLKSAQLHFRSAVHDTAVPSHDDDEKASELEQSPIALIVNAARGMRAIEVEIRKLRKTIRQAHRATRAQEDIS